MKRLSIIILSAVFFTAVSLVPASAQRTYKGQSYVNLTGFYNLSGLGLNAEFGGYLISSLWGAEVTASQNIVTESSSGEKASFLDVTGGGKWQYRLLKTRSRNVNLYGGGDAFLGVQMLDPFKTLTQPTRTALLNGGYSETKFIFGFGLDLSLEIFVMTRLCILADVRVPFTFLSMYQVPGLELGVGIRYNL